MKSNKKMDNGLQNTNIDFNNNMSEESTQINKKPINKIVKSAFIDNEDSNNNIINIISEDKNLPSNSSMINSSGNEKINEINEKHLNEKPFLISKSDFKIYKLNIIGEGSFGEVFKVNYKNKFFAMKIAKTYTKIQYTKDNKPYKKVYINKKSKKYIQNEIEILKKLNHLQIPKILEYNLDINYYIMPLYNISLISLLTNIPEYFNKNTIRFIGLNILNILEYLQNNDIIYRDIKPDNIMMDFNNKIILIDYGMAIIDQRENYIDLLSSENSNLSLNNNLYNLEKNSSFSNNINSYNDEEILLTNKIVGTPRYCSLNTHRGFKQSKRDDLESLSYMLCYLFHKKLPWNTENSTKLVSLEELEIVYKIKENSKPEQITNIKPLKKFIKYTRNLSINEEPNYEYLKYLLNNLINNENSNSEKNIFSPIKSKIIEIFKKCFCCF